MFAKSSALDTSKNTYSMNDDKPDRKKSSSFFSAKRTEVFWDKNDNLKNSFFSSKDHDEKGNSESKPFFSRQRSLEIQKKRTAEKEDKRKLKEERIEKRKREKEKAVSERKRRAEEQQKTERIRLEKIKAERERQSKIKELKKRIQKEEREEKKRKRNNIRGGLFYSLDLMKRDLQKLIENKPPDQNAEKQRLKEIQLAREAYSWVVTDDFYFRGENTGILASMTKNEYEIVGYKDGKEVGNTYFNANLYNRSYKDYTLERAKKDFRSLGYEIDEFKFFFSPP